MRKAWFRPKTYGMGYTPASWEGWAATLAFIALFMAGVRLIRDSHDPRMVALGVAGLTLIVVAFLALCIATCPGPPRWRWGDKDRGPPR